MQNYLNDWINKYIVAFFNDDQTKLLKLLNTSSSDPSSFENKYKNIFTKEDLIKPIFDIVRTKFNEDNQIRIWQDFFFTKFLIQN